MQGPLTDYRCASLWKCNHDDEQSQVKEVKALIGFFDLDPKRVYDLVLEAYEQMPDQAAFLQLTALFSQEARTQILGFRFARIASESGSETQALFQIAAELIKVWKASCQLSARP